MIGAMTDVPVVAVPTSTGQPSAFGGLGALMTMLNSAAPGVVVSNIDNGYSAGVFAARVARRSARRPDAPRRPSARCGTPKSATPCGHDHRGDDRLAGPLGAGRPATCCSARWSTPGCRSRCLTGAVGALPVEQIRLVTESVTRHGLGATRVHVHAPGLRRTTAPGPTSAALLVEAALAPAVRDGALAVFERLAVAEGRVHRISPDEVHFHEVGALDALADVVGVVAGFEHLGLHPADRLARSLWAAARPAAHTASSRSPARPCWNC